jgi:hypothetical protein
VSDARWSEVDINNRVLVVPPERFKSGVSHRVMLSDDALAVVRGLPRTGEFLFSYFGTNPINGWSRAKDQIDSHMGDIPDWKIHDLRHTVRTRMAAMRIPDVTAEMVLGHARRGMQRVYDQHSYEAEVREALEQWARLLRTIVAPAQLIELRRMGDDIIRIKFPSPVYMLCCEAKQMKKPELVERYLRSKKSLSHEDRNHIADFYTGKGNFAPKGRPLMNEWSWTDFAATLDNYIRRSPKRKKSAR